MIYRNIQQRLLDVLADTPVVLPHGARQTGKTTWVRAIAREQHSARYVTFDDPAALRAAQSDPQGFTEREVRYPRFAPSVFRNASPSCLGLPGPVDFSPFGSASVGDF